MNVDLSAIPQMELTRRYREARRVWLQMRGAATRLGITEREYCDRAIALWFPEPITWASSNTTPTVLDYERAWRDAALAQGGRDET